MNDVVVAFVVGLIIGTALKGPNITVIHQKNKAERKPRNKVVPRGDVYLPSEDPQRILSGQSDDQSF